MARSAKRESPNTCLDSKQSDCCLVQTDSNRHTTAFTYDELDRLIRKDYVDGAFETNVYDENSNLAEHLDAKGQLSTFAYDELNRQTLQTLPEDPATTDDLLSIAQIYDANGNVIEVRESFAQSGEPVTTRTYDLFDRLETVTDRWANRLRYAYDANGNRTQLTDPSNQVTSYAYDALNRLSTVTTSAGVTEYTYFRDSRIKNVTYPNGTTAGYIYDEAGRPRLVDNRHNGARISRFEYTYDKNGNRITQTEEHSGQAAENTTYSYDLADRLLGVSYPEKTTVYTFDEVGNRLTEQERDLAGDLVTDKLYTYNDRNQLERLDNLLEPALSVSYGYDANGNQVSRSTGAGELTQLSFDVLDRLSRVEQDGLALGTYRYDARGLRIEKLTAEGSARYVYDDRSVLTLTDADGTTKFEYGPDRLLSVADPTDGRAFYVFDALGSVSDLTTPLGTLLARYKYDAWGNFRDAAGSAANPFGFTGHEHEDESGLIYAKARFYDPATGRFLSEDPLQGDSTNPPSLHKYLYAHANPTAFIDPTGLAAEVSWSSEDDIPEGTVYFVVEEKTKDGTQQVFYNADPEAWTAADTFLFGGPEAIRERSKDLKSKERGFFGDFFAGVAETVSGPAKAIAERLKPGRRTIAKLEELDESFREAASNRKTSEIDSLLEGDQERFQQAQAVVEDVNELGVAIVEDSVEAAENAALIRQGARALVSRGKGKKPGKKSGGGSGGGGSGSSGGGGSDGKGSSGAFGGQGDALDIARKAAQGFKKLECVECAKSVVESLKKQGITGQIIKVRARNGRDFIVANRFKRGQEAITRNGRHEAVRVGDTVFDNLSPDGIPADEFFKDLHAIDGVKFTFIDF